MAWSYERNVIALIVLTLLVSALVSGAHSQKGNEADNYCQSLDNEPPRRSQESVTSNGFSVTWSGSLRFNTKSGFRWLQLELRDVFSNDREGNSFTLNFACGTFNIIRWPREGLVLMRGQLKPSEYRQINCNPTLSCANYNNQTLCGGDEARCADRYSPGDLELIELIIKKAQHKQ